MKRRMLVIFASVFILPPVMAAAQSFEFSVERERLLRNHRGTLVITPDGIEYRTDQKNESRSWRYKDIQQIKIESPTVLEILTYEDQRRMLGRDRIFRFRLLEGKITSEVSALLVARASRPVATSVAPEPGATPKYDTAVKHLHAFGGCEGALRIYPDHVTFESTDKPEHSRYWRYADIQGFGHPSRYRFEIITFEDKFGGPTKLYDFQLKEDLPASAYDYVWVRVNPAEIYPYGSAATRDALAGNAGAVQESGPRPQIRSSNPELVTAPGASAAQEREASRAQTARAVEQDDAQAATVEVTDKGFKPSSLKLKAGAPAKVTFVRKTDATCAKEVVIKEYNINRKLPLNEPVTVEFTPHKGEFSFACGMDMIKGKLIVE